MSTVPPEDSIDFASAEALGQWLKQNHDREGELWVKLYKKKTGIPSVTWDELVIECLCWGWIDGTRKTLDDQAYLQRITPRKARSNWSRRNTEHVERLLSEGRMQEPGLVQVRAAKSDGRWDAAYAVSEMAVPEDFIQALEHHPEAKRFFDSLTKSSRYVIARGLLDAKKPETRSRRFDKFMVQLGREEKPG